MGNQAEYTLLNHAAVSLSHWQVLRCAQARGQTTPFTGFALLRYATLFPRGAAGSYVSHWGMTGLQ